MSRSQPQHATRALGQRSVQALSCRLGSPQDFQAFPPSVFSYVHGTMRCYELRVRGVTDTFCADCFRVIVTEITPGSRLLEWSVRLPNGHERRFAVMRRDGALDDLDTLRFAFQHALAEAIVWGVTFRDIVPATEMARAIREIAMTMSGIKRQLEAVEEKCSCCPATLARRSTRPRDYVWTAGLLSRIAELNELMARLLRPVDPPRR